MTYELTQWIPLIVIVGLTVFFYIWGQREKRNRDVLAEQTVAVNDESFTPSPELD